MQAILGGALGALDCGTSSKTYILGFEAGLQTAVWLGRSPWHVFLADGAVN